MSADDSTVITRKITALAKVNDEIIERIRNANEKAVAKRDYVICQEPLPPNKHRTPYQFTVKEVVQELNGKELLAHWRVPRNAERPIEVDPDKTLYGELGALMDFTCETFDDLIRINKQVRVAVKYTTMLRESVSVEFGVKFLRNFEIVQELLGLVDSQLVGSDSKLTQVQEQVQKLNKGLQDLFSPEDIHNSNFLGCISSSISYISKKSTILNFAMESALSSMLTQSAKLRWVHDSTNNTTAVSFDSAVRGVGPTLLVIKASTGYVFGAYVQDKWGAQGGWIPGSRDTFLFTFGIDCSAPIKLLHSGKGNGIHITSCGVHLGGDLVAFCSSHDCSPEVYTTIAPGYPTVPVTPTLLAGAQKWTPLFMEVFAVTDRNDKPFQPLAQ